MVTAQIPFTGRKLGFCFDAKYETEAVARRCSVKKVFLEISKNSQEKTSARVSFLKTDSGTGVFL